MAGYRNGFCILGSGYIGSPSIQTSTANQEIIQQHNIAPHGSVYKFTFKPYNNCTIIINDLQPMFLEEGQAWSIEKEDAPITSFVIVESGVSYIYWGAY